MTRGTCAPVDIMRTVESVTCVSVDAQRGPDRHKRAAFARHVAMYLMRRMPGRPSLHDIGAEFGGRDHKTVREAVLRIAAARATDAGVDAIVGELEKQLGLARPSGEHAAEMAVYYEAPEPMTAEERKRSAVDAACSRAGVVG